MKFGDENAFHFSVHVMQNLIMVVHYIQMHCEWENESKTILNTIICQSLFAHNDVATLYRLPIILLSCLSFSS